MGLAGGRHGAWGICAQKRNQLGVSNTAPIPGRGLRVSEAWCGEQGGRERTWDGWASHVGQDLEAFPQSQGKAITQPSAPGAPSVLEEGPVLRFINLKDRVVQ